MNERLDRIEVAVEANTASIAANTASIANLERVMRQGFATLTELHLETRRDLDQLIKSGARTENALNHLLEIVANHENRIHGLEGGR